MQVAHGAIKKNAKGIKFISPAIERFMEKEFPSFTKWYDNREGNMQLDRDKQAGAGSGGTHVLQGIAIRHLLYVVEKTTGKDPSWKVIVDPSAIAMWVSYMMVGSSNKTITTYLERMIQVQSYVRTMDDGPTEEYMRGIMGWTRRVTCHFRGLNTSKDRDSIMEKKQQGRCVLD